MYTVCLVEDELALSNIVKLYLERAGYEVICFSKGSEAINYIGNKVDIWILDIMLGDDISGYNVIKAIREKDELVPVIFTSARDQELDKIFGLELGSDDYMTKPYSSKELVLRVNNIIKRVYKDNNQNINIIKYDDYTINIDKRIVEKAGEEIKTSGFVAYQKEGWTQDDLIRLKTVCDVLIERGAEIILTNNNTELVRELFKNYYQKEVAVRHYLNCKGNNRWANEIILSTRRFPC